jgi:uncharacterized coiled-coil protein SlyX
MFTSQSTVERRAAKEKRMAMAEERLSTLENVCATTDMGSFETRLTTLEAVKPVDLNSLEGRITALEGKPAAVVDFSPLESRLATLESAKPVDLSDIETRLVVLEKTFSVMDATLKALASRSDDYSETVADIRKRLDSAEANAAIVKKELDDMKSTAAKKPVGGGFSTGGSSGGGSKNFAFPAKKKGEESND